MPTSLPTVQRVLHYRGDVRDNQWVGRRLGPNTLGETLFVIDWTYDPDYEHDDDEPNGMTTVGLAYIDPTPERRTPLES